MSGLLSAMLANDLRQFHWLLSTTGIPSYPMDFHLLNETLLYGRTSMACLLLKYGCSLDVPGFRGNSPLHLAVHNDDCPELIEHMLIKGAVVSRVDPRGDSVLHVAFENNADEKVVDMLLIGLLASPVSNETNETGLTYLHIAASRPDLAFVRCLCERDNTDVNCQVRPDAEYYAGYTPLHMAVEHAGINVAESLLNYGADLYAKDANGSTPIHLALERRDEDMIEMLFDYDFERVNHVNRFGLSHFMAACACENSSIVSDFLYNLANGYCALNINEKTVDDSAQYAFMDYTPLLMAVEFGHLENVRLLLVHGADTQVRTCQGLVLERVAARNEYFDIARLIDMYTQDYQEINPIAARGFTRDFNLFRMDWSS